MCPLQAHGFNQHKAKPVQGAHPVHGPVPVQPDAHVPERGDVQQLQPPRAPHGPGDAAGGAGADADAG